MRSLFSSAGARLKALAAAALACALFAFGGTASAQPQTSESRSAGAGAYLVRSWTTADGLPVNYIGQIHQCRGGYLWLTTSGGLVRFDGRAFDVFTRKDIGAWGTSFVESLYEGRSGALWFLSRKGELARYQGGAFRTYPLLEAHYPVARLPHLIRFHEDRSGAFWLGGHLGLLRIEGEKVTAYAAEDGWPGRPVRTLHEDAQGRIWALTDSALVRVEGERVVAWQLPFLVRDVAERRAGGLWAATSKGLKRFENGHFISAGLLEDLLEGDLRAVHEDPQGRLWLTTGDVLVRWDGQEATRYTTEDGVPAGSFKVYVQQSRRAWIKGGNGFLAYLDAGRFVSVDLGLRDSGSWITATLQEDHEGNLWVGAGSGLVRLTPRRIAAYTPRDGLPAPLVFPVLQDRAGAMWLGTWGGGLHRVQADGRTQTFTTADGLPDNRVRALHESRDGSLWVGTRQSGVARLRDGRVTDTLTVGEGQGYVRALYEDPAGRLWIGENNLYRWDGQALRRHGPDALRRGDYTIHAIHEDNTGAVWVTTRRGLFRMKAGQWRRFTTQDGLSSNFVMSVYEEPGGALWFTTHGAGLNRYAGGHFFAYGAESGLPGAVWRMLDDGQGHFWMSTDNGLFRVEKRALEAFRKGEIARISSVHFTEADGMPSAEGSHAQPAGWKAADGRLWFPTIKGAAVVDPARLALNPHPPPVHIEHVTADGRPVNARAEARLAPGSGNVEFHYTALSFTAPEENRFRYKLEGYDDEWVEAGTRRAAFYTNLPPGRYRFRVMGSNNDGVWNEAGAAFAFTLTPRFYQTFWFHVLWVLGVIGLGVAVHRLRLKNVYTQKLERQVSARTARLEREKEKTVAQAEKLREMDRRKSEFFANVSHEFRTPLTLILGPVEEVLGSEDGGTLNEGARAKLAVARRNALQLNGLVNQLLDLAQLEAGRLPLRIERSDLAAFARGVVRAHTPLAERCRVHLRFRAEAAPLPAVFDPEKLQVVLGNLLSNALKFTPEGGQVLVCLSTREERAVLRVQDNGPGIAPGDLPHIFDRFYQADGSATRRHEGTGIGLALAKELVEVHGGTIRAASEEGFGATFTVELPRHADDSDASWLDAAAPSREPASGDGQTAPVALEGLTVQAASSAEEAPAPPDDAPTLLLVEDNADVRALLRRGLAAGYHIAEAEHGRAALEQIRACRPDLIISDVMMPEMDGLALCRALQEDDALGDLPVILLTARAGEANCVEGLHTGADAYVKKPFDMAVLKAQIRRLIESRRGLRRRFSREVVLTPTGEVMTSEDEAFYEKARAVVEAHLRHSNFTVGFFAQKMGTTKGTLTRKLKTATGMTPAVFVRVLRLERAVQLLEKGRNVSETADAVGYDDVEHFSTIFQAHHGTPPSQYPPPEEA